VDGLRDVVDVEPLDVETGGLVFREVLSVTRIAGGIADNVIPDRVEAHLNFRYAPTRTPADAHARLRELVDGRGTLEITADSAPARVAIDNPLVQRLRAIGDLAVAPKQAWTPVAEFSQAGLDAINFGPGAPAYAHRRDERVEIAMLERAYESLRRFVAGE
jgi:succinyl-diaminopimelate desuccinylase